MEALEALEAGAGQAGRRHLDAGQRVAIFRRLDVDLVSVDLEGNRIAGMGRRGGHHQRGEYIKSFHRIPLGLACEPAEDSMPGPASASVMRVTRPGSGGQSRASPLLPRRAGDSHHIGLAPGRLVWLRTDGDL